ncbi:MULTISPECIES: AraC family transcriptional regulator [Ralstonia solanacearum species complex]|uniref:Probable transcriptional regulator transcription regulator protein n=1 Tax=Ralstonia nicotianae (strain ATCC BAA-1114 / GMI1000) TaxID=267608 RepID=Q8XW84_RALN1|nr:MULTISPECIES: AraC family transcriptional regulator [Ralstonia solanacearum species complex]AST28102.1 AraC family transcriptional regulator [Ralstonia pseudosolanacearum]MCL9824958.1 AraC family transcriptional regulator [Ralstonia solanacearum]MCL9828480.1 AraC family transcriptional regulator [Ralstonia solanacearum]MCL9833261.1 AraC family transcriptional regulator [Ralstonia solanacearum]MCQ4681872.1 AraC family transcriptional regulator [Ralstonia pseudosolanacearum]
MINLDQIRAMAMRHAGRKHPQLPRLFTYTLNHTTEVDPLIYDPAASLVVQGTQRMFIGEKMFEYGPGQSMVVAAEIAALGQVCEASEEKPFIAVGLFLDQAQLSDLVLEMAALPELPIEAGYGVSTASASLLGAWGRLLGLLDRPNEIPVMAQSLEHEIMFRLLMGPHGGLLRQIAGADSRLMHIRRAMAWIRDHYTERLDFKAVAALAGMSVSVFYDRFKAVAAVSPLQYQKYIRLHEARRRMIANQTTAAEASYVVGYESASQFSREYKRLFGAPPGQDTEKARLSLGQNSRSI